MSAHHWPPGAEIQVRMGVHTGEASPSGDNYVALPLHQVARIAAGAHGGQILVSQATATAAEGGLPPRTHLAALGSFQLRGFAAPEPISSGTLTSVTNSRRCVHRGPGPQPALPPRQLRRAGRGPIGACRLAGHNRSGHRRRPWGRREDTPRGPGGLRPARRFRRRCLAGRAGTVVRFRLGFQDSRLRHGHRRGPGQSTEEVLASALGSKSALLILDNCEHLLDAVAAFAQTLSERCPNLVILSTSREPLDIDGEVVWRVEPFPTLDPDETVDLAELKASDAVRLFTERAALVRPGFQLTDDNAGDISRIVFHLSGMPLAIELAAAALAERSLSGVLGGLEDRFSLLVRGRRTAPTRHQTLRAAIEWSLDLLESAERLLFDRLSVFAGGGTSAAAAEVCGGGAVATSEVPELLGHLVRASLVSIEPESPDRWTMLESIRELGMLELADGDETEEFSRRHRRWALGRIEAVEDQIGRRGQTAALAELADERDNVRRAISAVSAQDAEIGLRMRAPP